MKTAKDASIPPSIQGPGKAFPESELPKWLLRQFVNACKRLLLAAQPPPYETLASFSRNLATCVRTGVAIDRGLEACVKGVRRTSLGVAWSGAGQAVREGSTLADALSGARDMLPLFYLPVIRAGEQSGRLDDALAFLESHCKLLAGPASALRNAWLFPVAIMLLGTVLKVVLTLVLASFSAAVGVLVAEVVSWLWLFLIVAVLTMTPARYVVDQVRLLIPFLGELEREIALHRFFRVLALLYSVSGQRVEEMIRMSAGAVSNNAARLELLKAAKAIERQASIPDAFHEVPLLSSDEKLTIDTGEMSGSLEQAFDRIADETGASMLAKLQLIRPLLIRIVITAVMASLIGTLVSVLGSRP